jgi:hypothetical protein
MTKDRINSTSDDSFKFSASVLAENDNCGLCKESLIFSSASTLPCGHVFHDDCVEVLRSFGVLTHACPTCRPLGNKGPSQANEDAARLYIVVERRVNRGDATWDSLSPEDRSVVVEAVKLWEESAGDGNLNAQNNIGMLYLHGKGIPKDHAKARQWFKEAADRGFPEAQYNLGKCLTLRVANWCCFLHSQVIYLCEHRSNVSVWTWCCSERQRSCPLVQKSSRPRTYVRTA